MSAAPVSVLGGGAWGTALAVVARRAGHAVTVLARDRDTVASITQAHENPRYLPGIPLDPDIAASTDPRVLRDAGLVLAVVPTQQLRAALQGVAPHLGADATVVLCAKGIEQGTGLTPAAIAAGVLPGRVLAVLSGPSFAADVARSLPTAVVVAADDAARAADLAATLSGPTFRCYSTDDVVGVELGGALKNVLAIAAGAVIGAGLGASAQAALVTRGFVEMRRLAVASGARAETLMGLSGMGDLMLTCASAQSRNFSYGLALGRGESLAGRPLAEGAATAGIAARLAREHDVAAPIIETVDGMLRGVVSVEAAVSALMSRPLRSEDE